MSYDTFGERLRTLRHQRNLTLRELSEKVNISYSALGNYERNFREPNLAILIRIAEFFNVDVGYLLGINLCENPSNNFVVEDLGLSENSINIIKSIEDKELLNALSTMIEHPKFISFLSDFACYKHDCKDKSTTEKSFEEFYDGLSQNAKIIYAVENPADYEYLLFQSVERQLEYMLDRPKDIIYPNNKTTQD